MPYGHITPGRLTRRGMLAGSAGLLGLDLSHCSRVAAAGANCSRTSVGFTPLPDLGSGTYDSVPGGLYPDGQNQPPAAYLRAGLAQAAQVLPRGATGQASLVGRIVLLSIGMSNATQEFSVFKQVADPDPRKAPHLTIVDGGPRWAGCREDQESPVARLVSGRSPA